MEEKKANGADKEIGNEVVENLSDKFGELFENLDKRIVPPSFKEECLDDTVIKQSISQTDTLKDDTVIKQSISQTDTLNAENNTRQWYNPKILVKSDDEQILPIEEIQKSTTTSTPVIIGMNVNRNEDSKSFQFKFANRYDSFVEQNLYPKFYQKFKIGTDFVIQRTGSYRTVCLTCHCELLMQKSNQNIVNHISGHRHMRRLSNPLYCKALKNYHDTFYTLEPNFQAHQVYFVPDEDYSYVKCVLCVLYVKQQDVVSHILNDPHKSKVISLQNDNTVKYSFYLLDQHLEVYGIKPEVKVNKVPDVPQLPTNNTQAVAQKRNRPPKSKMIRGARNDGDFKPHEIIKSVEDPNNPDLLKTLPRRFSHHKKFLKSTGSSITCTACENKKGFSKEDIQLHLVQPSHLGSTRLSLLDYLYFCEICDMKFHDEMTWHLHFTRGPNKHQTMASSRKDKVCEHECLTCKVIIFGDILSLTRHQNSFIRKIEKKKEIVLPESVEKYFASKSNIFENEQKLFDDAQNVLNVQDNIQKCLQDMESALSGYFKKCKAYPFGSRISGLGSSDSDLDVFVDIGNMYEGIEKQDEQNQFEIIRAALEMFRKKKEFYKITSRPTARTPIIRLKHRLTNLDCDISFRHGLSVENTKFLRFCFQLQPIAQKLILLLKKWSHLCALNENITTYAFAMMTIFYLQTEKYLISVKTLKELNPTVSSVIDGWETITYTTPIEEAKQYVKIYKGDIIELLKGFFKYYSEFKYKTDVICPLMGDVILKSQFTEDLKGGKLPKEMGNYIRKINHEEQPEYFRSLSEFCIQDPFDLSHNLTKACTPPIVDKLRKLSTLTYEMMNKFED